MHQCFQLNVDMFLLNSAVNLSNFMQLITFQIFPA